MHHVATGGGLSLCGLSFKFLLIYYHFFPITNIWAQLCNTLYLHGNFQLAHFKWQCREKMPRPLITRSASQSPCQLVWSD